MGESRLVRKTLEQLKGRSVYAATGWGAVWCHILDGEVIPPSAGPPLGRVLLQVSPAQGDGSGDRFWLAVDEPMWLIHPQEQQLGWLLTMVEEGRTVHFREHMPHGCPHCGAPDPGRFCSSCGMRTRILGAQCRMMDHTEPETMFCEGCGAALRSGVPPGPRFDRFDFIA